MRLPSGNASSSNMENSLSVEELAGDAAEVAAEVAADVAAARAAEDAEDARDNTQSSFVEEEVYEETETVTEPQGESLATGAFTNDSQAAYESDGSEELVEEVLSEDEDLEEEFVDDDGEYTVEEVEDDKNGPDLSQVEEAEDSTNRDITVEDASSGAEEDGSPIVENVASRSEALKSNFPPYDDDDDNTTEGTSNIKDDEKFGDDEEIVVSPPPGSDENPWSDEAPAEENEARAAPLMAAPLVSHAPEPTPAPPLSEASATPMQDVPLGPPKPETSEPVDLDQSYEKSPVDEEIGDRQVTKDEEEAYKEEQRDRDGGGGMSGVTMFLLCLLCCLLIAAIIAVPLILVGNKDDDGDRDIVIPTPPPVTSPPTPSEPTMSPTKAILSWIDSGGPFTGPPGSGLGSSTVIRDTVMVTGGPDAGNGVVQSYFLDNSGSWIPMSEISGPAAGSGFGTAVDVDDDGMVVSAPFDVADGTDSPTGTVSLYQFNPTTTSWEPLGPTIRSNEGISDANSEFGSAVAIAVFNPYRVAVGAPSNNEGVFPDFNFGIGRVYTYDYDSDADTLTMLDPDTALTGDAASDLFGSAVDLSTDGAVMIVGAPGEGAKFGYAKVMTYGDGTWSEVAKMDGSSGGERFGASVTMLDDSGDVVAVGGPGFNSGAGKVAVYQRQSDGSYAPIGSELVGELGESLGAPGTVSGGVSEQGVAVVLGTATGDVRRFDLDSSSGSWDERYLKLDPMLSGVTSVSTTADASLVVVGDSGSDEVVIFEAEDPPVPAVPTPSIPDSPTDTPETSAPTAVPPPTRWDLVSGPFDSGSPGNGFGSSVSYGDTVVAVGAPLVFGAGAVLTYSQDNAGAWTGIGQVFGEEAGGAFGTAVDVTDAALLVGAPFTPISSEGTEQSGSAYYYERNGNEWEKVGSTVRGTTDLFADEFGASVAVSGNQILAIGAPGSSAQFILGRGRLYIYEFNGDWVQRDEILGESENEALGTSVDLSSDGNTVIVGSPSPSFTGFASVYDYTGSEWSLVGLVGGMGIGDGMGTCVKMLNPDGSLVAAGSPEYNDGAGRVVVLERGGGSEFVQLGPAIEGEPGDRLGDANSIGGNASYPSVVVATASGTVKRFDYDGSNWILFVQREETGYSPIALAAGPEHGFMVAAGNDEVSFYQQVA